MACFFFVISRISPYVFAKTLLLQTLPLGNRYMGTHTIERLERVSVLL